MSVLKYGVPLTRQPQVPMRLNRYNPNAARVVAGYSLHPSVGLQDVVTGKRVMRVGANAPLVTSAGIYANLGTGNYYDVSAPSQITATTQPVTFAWTQMASGTTGYSTTMSWVYIGGTQGFLIYQSSADPNYYFCAGPRNAVVPKWPGLGAVTNGVMSTFVLVCQKGMGSTTVADYKLFRNGVEVAQSGTTTLGADSTLHFRIGALSAGGDPWEGAIGNFFVWDSALANNAAQSVSSNIFQLYEPIQRRIWAPVATAGGIVGPLIGGRLLRGGALIGGRLAA